MSMPIITLTSPSKTSIFHASEISKSFRDASFSSYLEGTEETSEDGSTQGFSPSISTLLRDHILIQKNKSGDREIDVFDAEKYFNDGLICHLPGVVTKISSHQLKKDDDTYATKEQSPIATPSIRSDSSRNSRRALLHTAPRKQPRKTDKKSFLASIGCGCSCKDTNSVDIDGENSCSKTTKRTQQQRGIKASDNLARKLGSSYKCVRFEEPELRANSNGHFSFPVFKSRPGNQAERQQVEEEPLEVFGSPILEDNKNCSSLDKKLTMRTWDALAPEEIRIPSISTEIDSENDSDGSSDLFEIESLSKDSYFISRQASDGPSGCITPTTCYAPSEVSIDWSVVTASAADFSVLSDTEELRSSKDTQKTGQKPKTGSFREIQKLHPSILSGCKSYSAVSVAKDAHRESEKGISSCARRQLRTESQTPTIRFHEDRRQSFDARDRRQSFDARVSSQSCSVGAAPILFT